MQHAVALSSGCALTGAGVRGACADMVKQMQAFQAGGPWVQARNFAVLTGVGAGLSVAL